MRASLGTRIALVTAVVPLFFFLAASATAKDVVLVWDPNPESNIAGYKIRYGTIPATYVSTPIDAGKVTTYTIKDLPEGAYFFTVTAYNDLRIESTYSNEVFSGPLTMVYPRLTAAGGAGAGYPEYTGLAVANLSSNAAVLRIKATDATGDEPSGTDIKNPVPGALNPGQQKPFVENQIFGDAITARSPVGWGSIDSSTSSVAGFFLMFDGNLTLLDGGNVESATTTSSILSEIEDQGFTRIKIINPRPDPVTATIELVGANGSRKTSVNRTIAARGSLLADAYGNLFTGQTATPSDFIRVNAPGGGIVASQLLGKPSGYLEFLAGQDSAGGATLLYSPQYAVGSQWRSTISVVNLDPVSGTVVFKLFGNDGVQIGTTRSLDIAANGKVLVSAQDFFGQPGSNPLTQGYVEVNGGGRRLAGSVVFGDPQRSAYATALPLVSNLKTSLLFSHVATSSLWYTGLAILNPNQEATTATVEVFDADGKRIGQLHQPVPPKGRVLGLLTQYFPELVGTDRTSGYIRVSTSDGKGIAAFALFGTNDGAVLSAIPTQIVQ